MSPPDAQRPPAGGPRGEQTIELAGLTDTNDTPPRYDLVGALDRIAGELHGLRDELARIAVTVDVIADYGTGVRL